MSSLIPESRLSDFLVLFKGVISWGCNVSSSSNLNESLKLLIYRTRSTSTVVMLHFEKNTTFQNVSRYLKFIFVAFYHQFQIVFRFWNDIDNFNCHTLKWFQLNHSQLKVTCSLSNELFSLGEIYLMKSSRWQCLAPIGIYTMSTITSLKTKGKS